MIKIIKIISLMIKWYRNDIINGKNDKNDKNGIINAKNDKNDIINDKMI